MAEQYVMYISCDVFFHSPNLPNHDLQRIYTIASFETPRLSYQIDVDATKLKIPKMFNDLQTAQMWYIRRQRYYLSYNNIWRESS